MTYKAISSSEASSRGLAASVNDPSSVPLIVKLSNIIISNYGPGAITLLGNVQANITNVQFINNGLSPLSKVYGGAIHINSGYDGAKTGLK